MSSLVRADRPHDQDLESLRSRLAELDARHQERSAALGRAQADLAAFKIRYRQEVGLLHDELDRLELAIAEAELVELTGRVEPASGPVAEHSLPPSRSPSRATRRTLSASCFATSPRRFIPTSPATRPHATGVTR